MDGILSDWMARYMRIMVTAPEQPDMSQYSFMSWNDITRALTTGYDMNTVNILEDRARLCLKTAISVTITCRPVITKVQYLRLPRT